MCACACCLESVYHTVSGQLLCGCSHYSFCSHSGLLYISQFSIRQKQCTKASTRTIYRSLLAYLATGRRWRQGKELQGPNQGEAKVNWTFHYSKRHLSALARERWMFLFSSYSAVCYHNSLQRTAMHWVCLSPLLIGCPLNFSVIVLVSSSKISCSNSWSYGPQFEHAVSLHELLLITHLSCVSQKQLSVDRGKHPSPYKVFTVEVLHFN